MWSTAEELLHFNSRKDEGADAFEVVVHDGFLDVIGERSVATKTEAGQGTALRQRDVAFGIRLDKLADDPLVALDDCRHVIAREIAVVDTLGHRIHEHARCGGFEVIARPATLINNLPPNPALRVLMFHDAIGKFLQDSDDLRSGGMIFREVVEHIYQRHGIPSDGAAPETRGSAGEFVSPNLFLRLVPPMVEQAAPGVIGVRGYEADLFRHVVV